MTSDERETKRRADDAANGCPMRPKPAGKPRDLIVAALPGTRQELRARTKLSNADTMAALASLMRDGWVRPVRGVYVLRS